MCDIFTKFFKVQTAVPKSQRCVVKKKIKEQLRELHPAGKKFRTQTDFNHWVQMSVAKTGKAPVRP